jgi:hypothetical protein
MELNVTIFCTVAAAITIALAFLWGFVRRRPVAVSNGVAAQPSFERVGGVTVDTRDWSPDVIEKIRETYFRPSLKGKYLQVMDLTVTCPRGHATRDRVVLAGRDLPSVKELSAGLLRSKAELRCDECGKPGKISGRAVTWEGLATEWDGAV